MERGWVNPGLVMAILSVMAMSCVGYFGSEKANLAYSNELTEVWGGKAELIVPAERRPTRAEMSPGGRWMLVLFSTGSDWRLLDLVTKTEEKVDVGCYLGDVVWLEDEVFVATNALNCYYLVNAPDLSTTRLQNLGWKGVDELQEVEAVMRQADEVYVSSVPHTVIALNEGSGYAVRIPASRHEEVKALLERVPHKTVSRRRTLYVGKKLYSPDGQFYAKVAKRGVEVYSKEGELVAVAGKENWAVYVEGWAHDSNGVYFDIMAQGADGPVLFPARPIFKLTLSSEVKGSQQ